MWEKLNRIPAQVILAVIIILGAFGLLYLIAFKEVPAGNRDLFNVLVGGVIGATLTPVIGWLYTKNKGQDNSTKP